jgi:DNA-binding NarL/FixJ family response regulator
LRVASAPPESGAVIRVAIVADSPVLRAGLASVFGAEPDVRIVATSHSRDDAGVAAYPAHSWSESDEVDVVIVVPDRATAQGEWPHADGSDLDERALAPATMVLLERMETSAAQDAYASGASAVLAIDASADELHAALRAVAAGLVVIPSRLSTELFAGARVASAEAGSRAPSTASLTSREREVLALLAQGLANKVIASRLGITEHTVKTHIAAVYEKLNARNRAEVLVAAARQGLVML